MKHPLLPLAVLIIWLGVATGCATAPHENALVLFEFDGSECESLGLVTGQDPFFDLQFVERSIEIAWEDARRKAYEMGANVIYVLSQELTSGGYIVTVEAFQCTDEQITRGIRNATPSPGL